MIPLNDLKRHNDLQEVRNAVDRVVNSGWYILGPEVEAFEEEFAAYCGVEHCVGVANGTDALELALRAVGVEPGDKVVTVANAGGYSTTAILAVGAIPIYVDVDPVTMVMSADTLIKGLAYDTAAIIVTHLYGQMADMPELLKAITDRTSMRNYVIEDCAHAHGAVLDGKKAGAWGDIGCFSFYPTKNLGALGDGGAITTNSIFSAQRVRSLRQYGWGSIKHEELLDGGRNSRLDEIQAAVLRAKLPHLDRWNGYRREIAKYYDSELYITSSNTTASHATHLYAVRISNRNNKRAELADRDIMAGIHYPMIDNADELPITRDCCESVLTLPCFPEMAMWEAKKVISAVKEVL